MAASCCRPGVPEHLFFSRNIHGASGFWSFNPDGAPAQWVRRRRCRSSAVAAGSGLNESHLASPEPKNVVVAVHLVPIVSGASIARPADFRLSEIIMTSSRNVEYRRRDDDCAVRRMRIARARTPPSPGQLTKLSRLRDAPSRRVAEPSCQRTSPLSVAGEGGHHVGHHVAPCTHGRGRREGKATGPSNIHYA